ncbi:phosphocholine cytidylyltransferase family protein [Gammaproteobacteria bacterium]|nr:phosphocholine cytidylyltransferase family protein [Gammaproteobacteria bacterium]MDA8815884.1 phosphocholine cytidylyltransferase family protein [Gammaproteobacteria bacterium]MDA9575116.1 phosphocholine cytidylyltransferase family protein [Gammaproteobacteria bacterium]MDA9867687.1 phosphocholine cytidylyltransferase family protein [Gammaproteobacteria bacterium]MDB0002804.1 phosphocholine cytidylyltransferase family protein [Gammaproteobacteria bacterium]
MKAIILAAGVGSRIRPLTDNCPKSLLKINGKTILEMMLSHIKTCGINEVIFVLGYLQDQIKDYVKTQFPDLIVQFITNEKYEVTNTGYSLMLTKDFVKNSTFIKFDADVVFDINILKTLIASEYDNCLCIDKNINLDAEEIKVIIKDDNRVVKASKTVNPLDAIGESIGIEKISGETAHTLFNDLELMMKDEQYHQEYYEAAYERLIEKDVPFYALDISGLRWTEIDTKEDFMLAGKIFSQSK